MADAELKDTVHAWLSSQRLPSEQDAATDIDRLLRGLVELHQAFQDIHAFLGRHPERLPQAQPILTHLLNERQSLLARVGERLLTWRLGGGSLDLRTATGEIAPLAPYVPGEGHGEGATGEGGHAEGGEGPPPVTAEALLAWHQKMKQAKAPTPRAQERLVPEERQRQILVQLMKHLGEPRDLSTTVGVIDEVDALEASTSPELIAQWALLSKPLQRAWLSVMVSRTRALKDIPSLSPGLRERIKVIILNYPAFAKGQQPGYVNGLQVAHVPEHGSWAADALHHWGILREMVREPVAPPAVVEVPAASPSKSKKVELDDEEEVSEPDIEGSWPLWARVRGKRAVLIGGEPREPARQRLQEAFELDALEWVPGDNPRRLDSLVERVHLEKVDVVLVLQNWIAHKVSNKLIDACKASHVPWALVGGYGVRSVRQGIERFLGSEEAK